MSQHDLGQAGVTSELNAHDRDALGGLDTVNQLEYGKTPFSELRGRFCHEAKVGSFGFLGVACHSVDSLLGGLVLGLKPLLCSETDRICVAACCSCSAFSSWHGTLASVEDWERQHHASTDVPLARSLTVPCHHLQRHPGEYTALCHVDLSLSAPVASLRGDQICPFLKCLVADLGVGSKCGQCGDG